jgi:hypothetical protein
MGRSVKKKRDQEAGVGAWRRGALVIFPARMHEVHTEMRRGLPLTMARTFWMFGFQRRLVRRWEWLTFMPNEGCLPQTSQTAAMTRSLLGRLQDERKG